MTDYKPYLKTLRRIPAPIIQAMATREIVPQNNDTCLCGWAIREAMAFANGSPAEAVELPGWPAPDSDTLSQQKFGGRLAEWRRLYYGVTGMAPDGDDLPGEREKVETAFAIRVAECVR